MDQITAVEIWIKRRKTASLPISKSGVLFRRACLVARCETRKNGSLFGKKNMGSGKDSPENGRLVPEMHSMLGRIRFLLEGHGIAESFEIAQGASLDGITVSLFKGGAAKLLRGFFLLKERIDTE
jgi:hypothetical protein